MPVEEPVVQPLLVGVAYAAAALGCGRTTVYKAIGEGHLRACKLGARTLIHVDELRRFADELARTRDAGNSGEAVAEPKPRGPDVRTSPINISSAPDRDGDRQTRDWSR